MTHFWKNTKLNEQNTYPKAEVADDKPKPDVHNYRCDESAFLKRRSWILEQENPKTDLQKADKPPELE